MEITILYIIVGLLTISNIFFIWRGTKLVKELEERAFYFNDMELEVSNTLEKMLNEMKEIDIRGSFESDDEVGAVFNELKDIIEKYKTNI